MEDEINSSITLANTKQVILQENRDLEIELETQERVLKQLNSQLEIESKMLDEC